MERLVILILVVYAVPFCPADAGGQVFTSIEVFSGSAYDFQTPLSISQRGQSDIDIHARYETRPFERPYYYAFRLGFTALSFPWEVQFIHHKLYLTHKPGEVQKFEITHGFNILTLNRLFEKGFADFRMGAGLVAAHTESTVRNKDDFGEGGPFYRGYRLAGPVALAGAGRRFPITSRFFVSADVQITAARVRVPVADGDATAPNIALHGLLGIGYRF